MSDPASSNPEKRQYGRPIQKGQVLNPAGRPKGSRNKLGEVFITALYNDFTQHGEEVIVRVRAERPADYLKVVASLLPKEFTVKDAAYEDLTDEQLTDLIGEVRAAHLRAARVSAAQRAAAEERGKGPDSVH